MSREKSIAEAAFALFAERGYADVRMEDVAARAGVAKGTLYLYFDSKQALLRGAIQHAMAPISDMLATLAAQAPPLDRTALHEVYGRLAALVEDGTMGTVLRLVLSESGRFPEVADTFFDTIIGPNSQRIRAYLEHQIESGAFRDLPARAFPRLFIAPTLMAALWKTTFERIEPLDTAAFLDAFADLALNGLRARNDPL